MSISHTSSMELTAGPPVGQHQQQHTPPPSTLSWTNISVRVTSTDHPLLSEISGLAPSGGLMALMGPSGSGKTTLLNTLAMRPSPGTNTSGSVALNGKELSRKVLRSVSTYVEQEDALIGALTVRESIAFAARLSGVGQHVGVPAGERVEQLVRAFGLQGVADTMVGTAVKRGISGGQKRRVSVAAQLITRPRVLFLDEPTSGLDSTAAYEVMSRIKTVAETEGMIVIASIHQPSTATFNLFSGLTLLSRGQVVYSGPRADVVPWLARNGVEMPPMMNPAEFLLDLCNVDFVDSETPKASVAVVAQLEKLVTAWANNAKKPSAPTEHTSDAAAHFAATSVPPPSAAMQTFILLRRLWLKSTRDILAYHLRVGMYLCLSILMGTVWLRLPRSQSSITAFMNALFFSGAFMSFMAVAYIPAFLEDLTTFRRERANGLASPLPFIVSNFLVGLPFIGLNVVLFCLVSAWLVGFAAAYSAAGWWKMVAYLFLDLVAAESLVVLVSTVVPIFVAALAITAFTNGLWMCVSGFLVPQHELNSFWYYTFYWINYQRYVFQGMMFNEFDGKTFECAGSKESGWMCMFDSSLAPQGKIDGRAILTAQGYGAKEEGLWVGVLIAIIVAMRMITWAILRFKK